jgi:menaquinone-dependent protoporphyrinogen oxidase
MCVGKFIRLSLAAQFLVSRDLDQVRRSISMAGKQRWTIRWTELEHCPPALDNVSVETTRNTSEPEVIARIGAIVEPYGGTGAYVRRRERSRTYSDLSALTTEENIMRVLIVYGTTEGHTRDLSEFMGRVLTKASHEADIRDSSSTVAPLNPADYDAVLIAASLHVGHYQPAVVEFARAHHEDLNMMPSAFISVSLSAAGVNPHDWEGLEQCVARFLHETLWRPRAVHQAAGAIRYSQYDFFKRLAIKFIASQRGQKTVMSQDYDLTDYPALEQFVLGFMGDEVQKRTHSTL